MVQQRTFSRLYASFVALLLSALVLGCGGRGSGTVGYITITSSGTSLVAGSTMQLHATDTNSQKLTSDVTGTANWTSSSPSIATVSSTGLVTGVSSGTVTITATSSNDSGTLGIPVGAPTVTGLLITPQNAALFSGQTQTYTATATNSDKTTGPASGAAWSVSPATVATIGATSGVLTAVAPGFYSVTCAAGGQTAVASGTVNTAALASVAITPNAASIAGGKTQQFTANGTYTDGSTHDLSSNVTWTSSNTALVTISATGLATAASTTTSGTVTITGTLGTIVTSVSVQITPAASATKLYVLPTSSSIAEGSAEQHTALAIFSDGTQQDVSALVTWGVSSTSTAVSNVAPGSGVHARSLGRAVDRDDVVSVAQTGIDQGLTPGTTQVTASMGSLQSASVVIVTPATVKSLAIQTLTTVFPLGSKQKVTLIGGFSDGTTQDLSLSANWQSSDPTIATINNSGWATGVAAGKVHFTASFGGQTVTSTDFQVLPGSLISTAIQLPSAGAVVGIREQAHLIGSYSDGTIQDLTTLATWASDDPSIFRVSSTGVAQSLQVGQTQISATVFGKTAVRSVDGVPGSLSSIVILPVNASFALGTTYDFAALGIFSTTVQTDISGVVVWTSSDPSVLTIDANGRAKSGKPGTATISATLLGVTQISTPITVTTAALQKLVMTPNTAQIAAQTSQQYTVRGFFSDGTLQDLSADMLYSISDPTVAAVDQDGTVSGVKAGTVQVSASIFGQTVSSSLTVSNATLSSVSVTPANSELPISVSLQMGLMGTFSDGTTQDLSADAIWFTPTPFITAVINAGQVAGIGLGTGFVQAQRGLFSAATTVNVTNATLTSLSLTPANNTIRRYQAQPLVLTGTFSDGYTQNLDMVNGIFDSDTRSVATFGGFGIFYGVGVGTATISGSFLGKTASTTSFRVESDVVTGHAITPASPTIIAGTTQKFSNIITYDDGTTDDASSTTTWTSSNPTILSIDGNGLATAHPTNMAVPVTITGVFGGSTSTASAFVDPSSTSPPTGTLTGITVTPTSSRIAYGTTVPLTATGTYSDGSTRDLTATAAWTTTDSSLATVSSTGLVTGLMPGLVSVQAQAGAQQGSAVVQVTSSTLLTVAISPSGATFGPGAAQQFTLTGTFSDGSTQNLSSSAVWSSSAPTVATISNTGLAMGISAGAVQFTARFGGKTAVTPVIQVSAATLVSVAISPSSPSFAKGTSQQFTVTGTYSDGSTRDLTGTATFVSSDPTVVLVSSTGSAMGLSPGSAQITATVGGKSITTQSVNVTSASLVSVAVTPPTPVIAVGTTQQFTATGTFSDGTTQNLNTQAVWTSSNPQVLTVNASGLASAGSNGTAQITATLNGITASTGNVTVSPAVLTNLTIAPTTAQIANGTTQQFTATGTFSDASTQNLTASVAWVSSNATVAAINASGLATGLGVGASQVTASYQGLSASTTSFSVTPATLVSVAFSPANPSVAVGSSEQVTVTGTYSDGTTQNLTGSATYTSSNPAAVSVSVSGVITGVGPGTSTVTVQVNGVTSTFTATTSTATLVSVAITPANPAPFAKGTTLQFTATGTYSDGTTQNLSSLATWTSSDVTVFTVDANGLATGTGTGSAHLTATYQGQTTSTGNFTVTPATIASIAVTPATPTITAGATQQFVATATNTDGTQQDVSSSVTWSSSNATLLSVDTNGLATAHATASIQTATITATYGTNTASATATVQPAGSGNPTLTAIVVKPTSTHAATGTTVQLSAMGTYSDGSTQDVSSSVTWSSANTANATVGSTGLVTALLPAVVNIQAQQGTLVSTAAVHVTAATLLSVAISPSGASFADGFTQQFKLTGTFTDGSTQDLSSAATWSSSNANVAFISSNGLAVGVSPGTVQFTAMYQAQSATTATVQLTPATLTSISISPSTVSFAAGTTTQFVVTGHFSDGSTEDVSDLATFSSSNPSVLAVSASGDARGAGAGTAQITATVNGQTVTTQSVTVTPATLVSIAITPSSPSIANGTNSQFTAIATFSDGTTQDVTKQATWTSNNPQILTIDQNGLASTDGTGSAQITAALNGITATSGNVTVTSATLTGLAINPASAQVAKGTTRQFTATGTFSDGSTQNLSTVVTWTSSNGSVVSINASGLATGIGVGSAQLTAAYQQQSASTTSFSVSAATLVSIAFSPANPSVAAGTSAQITTVGTFSDGSTQNLTSGVTYSTSNPSVATVDSTGLVSGVAPGSAVITVMAGGITNNVTVNVTTASLVSIAITPANPPAFAKGRTQQLTATGTYSDGTTQDLSSSVTWSSSNPAAITVDTHGLATGAGVGSAQLNASYQGQTATTPSVQVTPAVIASLAVSPLTPTISTAASQQFTATATYTDGTTVDVSSTSTWTSSSSTTASISATGLAQGLVPGTTTIQAVSGTFSASTVLTVNLVFSPLLTSITVTPANASLPATTTQQYTATGTYSDQSTANITGSVTWSSSTPAAATISSGGLATGIAIGTTTIEATSGAINGTTGLTVTAAPVVLTSIAITPASASIAKGATQQFTATGTYSDSSTQNLTTQVAWTSSASTVASIASNGSATGLGAGTTQITATYLGHSAMVTLTVSPATLVSLAVTPASVTVAAGTSQQYRAVGTLSDGSTQDLTTAVTWSSNNTGSATISASGLASTTASGSVTITAQSGSVFSTATLSVTAAAVASIQVTPSSVSLASGGTKQLLVTATFTDGSSQDVTSSATYSSSSPSIAAANSTGKLTATGAGNATITITLGSASTTLPVTVSSAVLTSIAITPSPVSLAVGTSQQLMATGTFSDGSTEDLTNSATWSSSASSTISVSSTGNAMAAQTGSATITAASGGVSGTVTVTGTAATVASITVSPASVTLAAGQTQQYTATATLSDSTQQDITASAHWSVSDPVKATVGDSAGTKGFLTSSAAGTITVSATSGSATASATLTIQPATLSSLNVTPSPLTLPAGTSQQLAVTGVYTDGSMQNLTSSSTFTGASPSTAAVSSGGLVHAVTAGSTSIHVTVQSVSANVPVTVSAAALNAVAITPAGPSLAKGLQTQLTATGTYTDGSTANISSSVAWASSAPAVATISNTGLLSGVSAGNSTVTATLNGISQSVPVTVTPAALQSISVLPAGASFPLGLSQQMQAIGTYTDGTTQDLSSSVTWSSLTPAVGVVSSSGLATGVTTGTFNAKAAKGTVSGTAPVTITNAILQTIVVTPANQPIINVLGANVQFTATGHYSDGSIQNITNSVHWAITAGISLGTITQTGSFSPTGLGLGTVTATSGSISGSTNFIVVSAIGH